MSATEISSDFDVNEAAANAKKLALSTNSAATWPNVFAFDYYAQIPPPNFYQSAQLGGGGLNFMTGSSNSFAPPPIPQLSAPPPPFARHNLSPRHPHPYHLQPPPFYTNFAQPPPSNYSHPSANGSGPWNHNDKSGDEVVERVARNPEMNGLKPIRFSLNPTGKKHFFNKPNSQNIASGGFGGGVRGTGPAGGKPNSRFGPPLNGTAKVTPPLFSIDLTKTEGSNNISAKEGYGLTNGSSWATASAPTPTSPAGNIGAGQGQTTSPQASRSRLESADFASCINSENWPLSLKKYAEKWFTIVMSSNSNDIDKAQDLLRQKMEEAYIAGDFKTRDWLQEELPVLPSSNSGAKAAMTPIPGTVKGTPLKVDGFPLVGRGRGRGRVSPVRSESFKNRQLGRPKGIRGRNRFRSRSTSRSWSRSRSRSRSSSSGSSSEGRSKKRKRHDSGSKTKKNEKKFGKKEKQKNKKQKGKKAHIYSEFGSVGGQVTEVSNARLNARAARFAKDEAKTSKGTMKSRLGGFTSHGNVTPIKWGIDKTPGNDRVGGFGRRVPDPWDMNTKIVGTSTDLEKMYLRLTTALDPSTIRPVHILRRSLDMVCQKWKKNDDYRYACDQLKSIRQDLTVQRVREPFTVLVYETHARIALEKGDHEEFNQCQSQLVQLYTTLPQGRQNQREFTAYRILYYIFTASTLDLGTVMAKLSDAEREDECIAHALRVRSAWAIGNYCEFFRLHKLAPKMSGYLIDWFVNRERKNALRKILKSYRPTVPRAFVQSQLDLSSEEGWTNFVKASQLESVLIYADAPLNSKINARDSHSALIAALGA